MILLEISQNTTLVIVGGAFISILLVAVSFLLVNLIASTKENFKELFRKHSELTTINNNQNTNIAVLNANFETHTKSDEKAFADMNKKLDKGS